MLPSLPGICQHDYRRNALQSVERDPPGAPRIRQDKVADVQFSRWFGTSRHHQALTPGPDRIEIHAVEVMVSTDHRHCREQSRAGRREVRA